MSARIRMAAAAAVISVLAVGGAMYGASPPVAAPSESQTPSAPTQLSLVGLGDSIPGALNCPPGCRSYVEVYGDLASQALQVPVNVLNLATNDLLDSSRLLSRVLNEHAYRTALAGADLITLTIGNNDQPSPLWSCIGDEPCDARAQTEQNIAAILREIASLRAGRPTAIRVTGYYDMAVGGGSQFFAKNLAAFNAMVCEVAEANGAVCVDLVPAFNGPDGSADAGDLLLGDHIHASKAGQELIAKTIDATGYAPLHVVGLPASSPGAVASPELGSPSPMASPPSMGSPSPAASPTTEGILVTGTFTVSTDVDSGFAYEANVENGLQQRNRRYTGHLQMDDARLTGDVYVTDNADRYCAGVCGPDTFRADILWGTIEMANDGGTWVGTKVGTTDKAADGRGIGYYQLGGTGAYEGLSAVLFETEVPVGDPVWNGVIFPGELSADR